MTQGRLGCMQPTSSLGYAAFFGDRGKQFQVADFQPDILIVEHRSFHPHFSGFTTTRPNRGKLRCDVVFSFQFPILQVSAIVLASGLQYRSGAFALVLSFATRRSKTGSPEQHGQPVAAPADSPMNVAVVLY